MSSAPKFNTKSRQAAKKLVILLETTEDFEANLDEYVHADGQIDETFLATLDRLRPLIQSDSRELIGVLNDVSTSFQEALLEWAVMHGRTDLLEAWLTKSDRPLAKVLKRVAHSLKTQGISIEDKRPRKAIKIEAQKAEHPPSLVSAIDSQGERVVWLSRDMPRGVRTMQAVLSPKRGVSFFDVYEISRSEYRKMVREITKESQFLILEVTQEYALFLMRRFSVIGEPPDRFITALSMISSGLDSVDADPVLSTVDMKGYGSPVDALTRSDKLHDLEAFKYFIPERTSAMKLEMRLQEIATSQLVVDDKQRNEQIEAAFDRAVDDYFGGEDKPLLIQSIRDMAALLHLMDKEDERNLALATADLLEKGEHAPSSIPFGVQTFKKLFPQWPLDQSNEEPGDNETSPGGIIMPGGSR